MSTPDPTSFDFYNLPDPKKNWTPTEAWFFLRQRFTDEDGNVMSVAMAQHLVPDEVKFSENREIDKEYDPETGKVVNMRPQPGSHYMSLTARIPDVEWSDEPTTEPRVPPKLVGCEATLVADLMAGDVLFITVPEITDAEMDDLRDGIERSLANRADAVILRQKPDLEIMSLDEIRTLRDVLTSLLDEDDAGTD